MYRSGNFLTFWNTKLVEIILKNSVRTAKKTQNFTVPGMNWITLFKEVIAVYSENHVEPMNTSELCE
jgi:hypothetical protein